METRVFILHFVTGFVLILSKQIIVSLQLVQRQSKSSALTAEQAGFSPSLPILLERFVGRALATIAILKNGFFPNEKTGSSITFWRNHCLPVTHQAITGKDIANLIVYTVTFSRCKPFSLGSHLLVLFTIMS